MFFTGGGRWPPCGLSFAFEHSSSGGAGREASGFFSLREILNLASQLRPSLWFSEYTPKMEVWEEALTMAGVAVTARKGRVLEWQGCVPGSGAGIAAIRAWLTR